MDSFNNMNNLQFDILKEIGNIGAGNAITSLAKLIGKKIKMTVPKVKLLEFKEVSDVLGNPEDLVFGILVEFTGDLNGIMMFILKLDSARIMINSMMGKSLADTSEFTEMDLSALQEIGNILSSSYLGALSTLINKNIMPSVPSLAKDMAAAILSVPAIAFGIFADNVLFIESLFDAEDEQTASGYFLLVPDLESFNIIMQSLGVM